ncbi:hypothetical protein ACW180_01565 [Limosilactobacillus fermentum]
MDDSFVPMGFRERDGKLVGYDIDLGQEPVSSSPVDFQVDSDD